MLRSTPLRELAISMAFIFVTFLCFSQSNDGLDFLKNGDYQSAKVVFEDQLGDKKTKIAGEYGLALLFSDSNFNGHKLEKAYEYIDAASTAIKDVNDRTKEGLKTLEVNSRVIRQLKMEILTSATKIAEDQGTEESFNYLLDNYKLKYADKNQMIAKRDSVVYESAREKNTYAAYSQAFDKYEKTMRRNAPTVYKLIQIDLFQSYIAENGIEKFDQFKEEHTNNPYVRDVGVRDYFKIKDSRTSQDHRAFIQKYPSSLYVPYAKITLQEIRMERLSRIIRQRAPERSGYLKLQEAIKPELDARDWAGALAIVKKFEADFGNDKHYRELADMLSQPDKELLIKSFGPGVNSKGLEYSPAISADSKTIFFCGSNRPNNLGGMEDIFVSYLKDSVWTEAQLVSSLCSARKNEAPQSVSADGNSIIIFNGGMLAYSKKTVNGWSKAVNFPPNINAKSWQSDGMITADGRALIFAAPGEEGFYGDNKDIYISVKQADGLWGNPYSLGTQINTPYNERDPFLHPDMKTLYFSSNGRGGFGDLDVFVTTRLDETWTNWSDPINLGKELNTTSRDWGYKVTTDGKKAIFAATFNGSDENLYEVLLPEELRPDPVTTVEGNVKGLNKEESAIIIVRNALTGNIIGEFTTEPGTGNYFLVLPSGIEPIVTIDKKGVISTPQKLDIDIKADGSAAVSQDLEVQDLTNLKVGEEFSISFEDLLFDTDKSKIKPAFFKDLDDLAANIKSTGLEVAIEGHTDDVGAEEYNLELSQKRAGAVRDYLITKGCSSEKIKAKGLGESQPIGSNETEAGKASNRRVEIKFSKEK